MRVLVVDDEVGIRKALTRLFTKHGDDVRTAANAGEAVGVFEEFSPDVVISDFKMEGMNGLELLRLVGERFPRAKRILLSGFADISEEPGVQIIAKPYVVQTLLQACR